MSATTPTPPVTPAPARTTEAAAARVFELRLTPLPRVDGEAALRAVLKRALRDHGMRCIAVKEIRP